MPPQLANLRPGVPCISAEKIRVDSSHVLEVENVQVREDLSDRSATQTSGIEVGELTFLFFVTIFTVGTGGLFDQRIGSKDLPKPAQWHRIAVHNYMLGAYAVQKLFKNSSVYIEGDIETRVYNDSINGDVKSIPEICVRRDGRIRLIKSGESIDKTSLDELREGLF
ncbi:single-stranded DNA-binding protein, mitochondrial [Vigna umbellata]|uniref:single-stranded DNA-binding protein, mitochondrial n=1 Tax=Vigna umbellata TaxID=87088 RepID=UPI001F5F2246|nr:single-stranded DNA-binding protein, mitochondrial [Vigna umbellata]